MNQLITQLGTFIKWFISIFLIIWVIIVLSFYSEVNELFDEDIEINLSIIEKRYTADFVYSDRYWKDRNHWYKFNCPIIDTVNRRICAESVELTHKEYLNDRYDSVYDRMDWIADDRPFNIKRWFTII